MGKPEQAFSKGRFSAIVALAVAISLAGSAAAQQAAAPSTASPNPGPRPSGMPPGATPPGVQPPGAAGKPDEKKGDAAKSKDASKDKDKDKDKSKGEDSKKGPEPIQRPAKPPEPPNPDELKVRPDAEGKVSFNFTGQPWQGVLQWLADISHMSLDWQELPGDYLNLTTQRPYTLDEVRDMINRHLLARGYTILRSSEALSVVKLDGLNPGLVPRVEPEDLDKRDAYEFVKVSFPLD